MTKLSKKYRWLWFGGATIQYGIPLSYIIYQYDIFRFEEAQTSLTGWGIIALAIPFFAFRNKIKTIIHDYNTNLGVTAQRGKWGLFFITMFGVFALASLWLHGMMWFMFTLGVSNLGSLLFYSPYDTKHQEYKELSTLLKTKAQEEKIKGVSI